MGKISTMRRSKRTWITSVNPGEDLEIIDKAALIYKKQIQDTLTIPCAHCRRLFFRTQLKNSEANANKQKNCATCRGDIAKGSIGLWRKVCMLGINDSLPSVSHLNNLKLRLVSICIPFVRIKHLNYEGQYGLRGSVVNVMADVERVQQILPQYMHKDAMVLVGIKQKLAHNHYYMSGLVRPLETT